jgi:hypothetical protein
MEAAGMFRNLRCGSGHGRLRLWRMGGIIRGGGRARRVLLFCCGSLSDAGRILPFGGKSAPRRPGFVPSPSRRCLLLAREDGRVFEGVVSEIKARRFPRRLLFSPPRPNGREFKGPIGRKGLKGHKPKLIHARPIGRKSKFSADRPQGRCPRRPFRPMRPIGPLNSRPLGRVSNRSAVRPGEQVLGR